jgi:DNA-binding PadR family transcriptional regulator
MRSKSRSRFAILGILAQGPCTGYSVRKQIEEKIFSFWHESFGQIYPTLKQLHAEGLVTKATEAQQNRPDRHVYAITEAGYASLLEWLRQPVELQPDRIEILLKLIFGRHLAPDENIQHLELHRQRMTATNRFYRQLAQDLQANIPEDPDLPYYLITLDYGIHTTEAIIQWCGKTIERLESMDAGPGVFEEEMA